jgi:demethylmenaquinone methyltransferase / 2-methoxy-6-polyprenyl-1,4-benzoquinol methylase
VIEHGDDRTASQPGGEADFGFRRVPEGEKAPMVRAVFESVAPRYDLMNDLMSGGLHRLWKATLIDTLRPRPAMQVLDVAGGTGDVAFRILRAMGGPARCQAAGGGITIADINPAMLAVGRRRATEQGLSGAVAFATADAERLPFASGSVDAYTIAFGIRNVTHIDRALAEARRVLKPGGRFLCLEFSHVEVPGLDKIYDRYSFNLLPKMGGWVAGDAESYRYLAESIRRFPAREKFAAMIAEAGLGQVKVRPLSGGIVAMHSAWRL